MEGTHLIEPDYNRLQTRKNIRLLLAAFKHFCSTNAKKDLRKHLEQYVTQLEELYCKGSKAKKRREALAKFFEYYRGTLCSSIERFSVLEIEGEKEPSVEECDIDLNLQAVILALQLMRSRQDGIKRLRIPS